MTTPSGDATHADATSGRDTGRPEYTQRLSRLEGAAWKRVINAQAPYRWNVRRMNLGFTLDVGCGIGRNLSTISTETESASTTIRIRSRPSAARGFSGFTIEEFLASKYAAADTFDSILVTHVVEHLPEADALSVVGSYLPFVKPSGKVVFITPQERGYASDTTHMRFVGFEELSNLAADLGFRVQRQYSFPLPRPAGKLFTYDEFICITIAP